MATISLEEMKLDPVPYLERAQSGEEIVILSTDGVSLAIKPLLFSSAAVKAPRPFGLCRGEFVVPDDFDAPLPDEVLDDFE